MPAGTRGRQSARVRCRAMSPSKWRRCSRSRDAGNPIGAFGGFRFGHRRRCLERLRQSGRRGGAPSVHTLRILHGARRIGLGPSPHGLAALSSDRRSRRPHRRHPAALPEKPFAGRICVRPWLGRSVRARGRRVLSQAPGFRAVHAGYGTALPDCGRRRQNGYRARRCSPRAKRRRANSSASSLHITFLTEDEWDAAGAAGYLQRTDQQFHWDNRGYENFDQFLGELSSAKRKNLRKERAAVREAGVEFDWLTGADITEAHWDEFFAFYMDTGGRKWGHPYLTREFFSRVGASMAEQILLIMARRDGRTISPARSTSSAKASLFGRNWGCAEFVPFLHFETCYYQAIDFAIAHEAPQGGSGRTRRAQIAARLYAGADLQRPLHRPSRACGARWEITSIASARRWRNISKNWPSTGRSGRPDGGPLRGARASLGSAVSKRN